MFYKINVIYTLFLCVLLLISTESVLMRTSAEFLAPHAYDGGRGFASGDLNADGNLDIAVAQAGSIFFLKGNGQGQFPAPPTPVFSCPRFSSDAFKQPMIGDFTGDGKPDIAAWMEDNFCNERGVRSLIIIPGNGNGGFSAPIYTDVSNFFFTPNQFKAGDFNGDSKLDVVISTGEFGDSNLAVFLGNGNGSFSAPLTQNFSSLAYNNALLVGDFNNDTYLDLAFAPVSQFNITVLPGNGNGTFGTAQTTATNFLGGKTTAGDFNNDGKLDIAMARSIDATIQVWLGNGNNSFQLGGNLTPTNPNSFVNGLTSCDLNNDGKRDLILSLGNRTVVFNGNGNGTFVEDAQYGAGGGQPFTGDFNNDGYIDIAAPQTLGSDGSQLGIAAEFAILLNLQNGKLLTAPSFQIPFGGDELAIDDFNNDGLKDLAFTGDAFMGEVGLILQNPADRGSFQNFSSGSKRFNANSIAAGASPITPLTLSTGDYNRDGKIDIVVAGRTQAAGSPNVIVTRNDGAGNLSLMTTLTIPGTVTKVISADFNADGILDLAFSQNREILPNTTSGVSVALGNGNGTFASPVGYLASKVGNCLAAGDFNGDNRPDLAVGLYNNKVAILLNNGTGGFTEGAAYDLTVTPTDIVAADMQGDGKADLIIAESYGYTVGLARIGVLNGNANGAFSAVVEYPTVQTYEQRLAVADFNGDGKPDVATSNNGVITLFVNNGNGGLTNKTLWGSAGGLMDIASTDLDGDNKIDLITTSAVNDFISINFLPNITEPQAVLGTPFDFDGDAKTDISIFRPGAGEWWINRSSTLQTVAAQFGASTDKAVPADFTGDSKADIAVFRPSTGEWFILRSEDNSFYSFPFGSNDDVPVVGDFDADGKADPTIYRPSTNEWFISASSGGTTITTFGAAGDVPVPADYDGDDKTDIAIYRPSAGEWWIRRSTNNSVYAFQFGSSTDKPVQGDYTGDGQAEAAFFRPSTGEWFILRSEDSSYYSVPFGTTGDLPVPGDYDGDGKFDTSVFRPADSTWYINRTTAGLLITGFGTAGDKPIPNVFVP